MPTLHNKFYTKLSTDDSSLRTLAVSGSFVIGNRLYWDRFKAISEENGTKSKDMCAADFKNEQLDVLMWDEERQAFTQLEMFNWKQSFQEV